MRDRESAVEATTQAGAPLPFPLWLKLSVRALSAASPTLGAEISRKLLFTPQKRRPRARDREVLDQASVLTWRVGGHPLLARSWGTGAPVLLLHGWGGHAGQLTSMVAPLVRAGLRPVALDLPGHGHSGRGSTSMIQFAEAIETVARSVGPLFGLVAHSLGAAAATYALSQGLQVARAVFMAPPARFDSIWNRFRLGLGLDSETWTRTMQRTTAWLQVPLDQVCPEALASKMSTPLLVVHSTDDPEIPYEEARALVQLWPGAQIHPLANLGHYRLLRDAAAVSAAVDFLAPPALAGH